MNRHIPIVIIVTAAISLLFASTQVNAQTDIQTAGLSFILSALDDEPIDKDEAEEPERPKGDQPKPAVSDKDSVEKAKLDKSKNADKPSDLVKEFKGSEMLDKNKDKEFSRLNLSLECTSMAIAEGKRIIFYLRPDGFINVESWKLYVFTAKLKKWNSAVVDQYALAVIKGKGLPPLNVVWEGILDRGGKIKPGKYYYVVLGEDREGNAYMTDWCKFKIE